MAKKKKTPPSFSKPIRWFWMFFLAFILSGISVFISASLGLFGEMPDHTALENPRTNLATEIISSDGKTLGKFYYEDNRTPVSFEELPKHLVDALIATEDVRYYEHAGIDARGTLRAFAFQKDLQSFLQFQHLQKLLYLLQLRKKCQDQRFYQLL